MEMFRLDLKKNILMKREGSHVGDVLIKTAERPGHHCAPPARLRRGYKQGRCLRRAGGWPPFQFPSLGEAHGGGACARCSIRPTLFVSIKEAIKRTQENGSVGTRSASVTSDSLCGPSPGSS